jgi:hypothetical protein
MEASSVDIFIHGKPIAYILRFPVIYDKLSQGMCGVNSADPRVESCVRQIVQLASTFEPGTPVEYHFLLPSLIVRKILLLSNLLPNYTLLQTQAGVAARQEKHRALVRSKISKSRGENAWLLRGVEFVPVLDHLWHGAGIGGHPTMWEDYVISRCIALPLNL